MLRAAFEKRAPFISAAARDQAYEELLIAEGSDWFWWYGDDHSSDQDAEFDDLFRRHVRNAYTALGLEPPAELFKTNISTAPSVGCGRRDDQGRRLGALPRVGKSPASPIAARPDAASPRPGNSPQALGLGPSSRRA